MQITRWQPAISMGIVLVTLTAGLGQSVTLDNILLLPPSGSTNRLTITMQTNIGTDTKVSNVTGAMSGILDFSYTGGQIIPSGLNITGGDISLSNVTFSFLFGLVTVSTNGVGGTPSTPDPPSVIDMGVFDASDHIITLNRGTINAAGTVTNLAETPIPVTGSGQGTVAIVAMGGNSYTATLSLPVQFNEAFEVTDVPIVGTVTGNIIGSGTIVARQQFTWSPLPGDYDFDGDLDCDDIDFLQSQILAGSTNLFYDVNGDGLVNLLDYTAWVTDLKQTLPGDANFDRSVDGTDFNTWNSHKFSTGWGWCQGDFTGDRAVDGADFNIWNSRKFTSASDAGSVPEPGLGMAALFTLGCWLASCVRQRGNRC